MFGMLQAQQTAKSESDDNTTKFFRCNMKLSCYDGSECPFRLREQISLKSEIILVILSSVRTLLPFQAFYPKLYLGSHHFLYIYLILRLYTLLVDCAPRPVQLTQ